jgi:hypothetical protein
VPIPGELVVKQQPGSGGSCLSNEFAQVQLLPSVSKYEAVWWSDIGLGSRWWPSPGTVGPRRVTGEGYEYQVPKGYAAWSAAGGSDASGGCPAEPPAGTFGVSAWGVSPRWAVSGYITVSGSGEKAPRISVEAACSGGRSTTGTNEEGQFEFLVRPGPCTVTPLLHKGQQATPASRSFVVKGDDYHVDFVVPSP